MLSYAVISSWNSFHSYNNLLFHFLYLQLAVMVVMVFQTVVLLIVKVHVSHGVHRRLCKETNKHIIIMCYTVPSHMHSTLYHVHIYNCIWLKSELLNLIKKQCYQSFGIFGKFYFHWYIDKKNLKTHLMTSETTPVSSL